MRRCRHYFLLLIPLALSIALAACQEPLAPPIGGLSVTAWPANPCGFFADVPTSAAIAMPTNGLQHTQLADCAGL